MTAFIFHANETAPAASQPLIEQSVQGYGFSLKPPQVLAAAPAAYGVCLHTSNLFQTATTL
jgi:hypothetical protein